MEKIAGILAIASGIFFGSVGIFVRELNEAGFNNITIVFTRTVVAAVFLFIYIVLRNPKLLHVDRKSFILIIVSAITCMLGTNLLYNVSSIELSLSFAAVLLDIYPIYVLLASSMLFGESVTRRKVLCIIMAIVGCVMVSGIIEGDFSISLVGVVAGLLSGVTYGAYGILSKLTMERGISTITIVFYCLLIISIVIFPFADFVAVTSYVTENPLNNILFMFAHSLCVSALSYLTYTLSLEYMEPGKASLLATCEPIAAMIFGLLIYSEIPTIMQIAGICVILTSLAMICIDKRVS